jgi:mannosyltransferase OCH1-like enzyme
MPSPTFPATLPANLFQTWHTKKLPPAMARAVARLRRQNPRFLHYLFDDADCRAFIQKYYEPEVVRAYDALVPGAYKADLWRYCVLYVHGGIYLDIKYMTRPDFFLRSLLAEECWVLDADGRGIYNALMVCKAGNPVLLRAIQRIVENVHRRFYGDHFLEPTGPLLLGGLFDEEEKLQFQARHVLLPGGSAEAQKCITVRGIPALECYEGYLGDRDRESPAPHYSVLWNRRAVYRDP